MSVNRFAIWLLACLTFTSCATFNTVKPDAVRAITTGSHYINQQKGNKRVVVFVHGVLGDAVTTWNNTNTNAYWPTMIVDDPDFADTDVYVYEYPTTAFGANFAIDELAEDLRRSLVADRVLEHDELYFLSHSMGGLVTRAFLLKYQTHAQNVQMAYFFATPTEGSPMATFIKYIPKANIQFNMLLPLASEDYLANLQRNWLAAQFGIKSFCAYERKETYGALLVDQRSACNLCTEPLDPILENHIDIVKPASKKSASYIAFKNAYQATPPRITIEEPRPGTELVEIYDSMRGKLSGPLPKKQRLWVIARDRYSHFLMYPPPRIDFPTLSWSQTNVRIGHGKWSLMVIIADEAASAWFEARKTKNDWSGFVDLPRGATPLKEVEVWRQ